MYISARLASDPAAVLSHTNKVVYLEDGDIAVLTKEGFRIADLEREVKDRPATELEWGVEEAQKGGYEHFMLKEIMEQPESLENALRGRLVVKDGVAQLGGLRKVEQELAAVERMNIIACGTAYYAGLVAEYMLEEFAGIPVEVECASELRYRRPIFNKGTALLSISQSGETADTLASLKYAKSKTCQIFSLCNVVTIPTIKTNTAKNKKVIMRCRLIFIFYMIIVVIRIQVVAKINAIKLTSNTFTPSFVNNFFIFNCAAIFQYLFSF